MLFSLFFSFLFFFWFSRSLPFPPLIFRVKYFEQSSVAYYFFPHVDVRVLHFLATF